MGLHWDMTITLGALLQLAGMALIALAAWYGFKSKIEIVLAKQDVIVSQHSQLLDKVAEQLREHERTDATLFHEIQNRLADLAGGVQRLVGQNEVFRRGGADDRRR